MPGRRLNDRERHARDRWNGGHFPGPTLRTIEVSGGPGLRGIDGLVAYFRYPLTAICGANGAGKSTLLSLCALAHHSPEGWFVHWGNTAHHRGDGDRSFHKCSDFLSLGKATGITTA